VVKTNTFSLRFLNKLMVTVPMILLICNGSIGNELGIGLCITFALAAGLSWLETLYVRSTDGTKSLFLCLCCAALMVAFSAFELLWLSKQGQLGGLILAYGVVPTLALLSVFFLPVACACVWADTHSK
jgi:hypothetical protein